MKKSRFSEEQIIGILREAEATPVQAVCARHNMSAATYYAWKRKFGGMDVLLVRIRKTLKLIRMDIHTLPNLLQACLQSLGSIFVRSSLRYVPDDEFGFLKRALC